MYRFYDKGFFSRILHANLGLGPARSVTNDLGLYVMIIIALLSVFTRGYCFDP